MRSPSRRASGLSALGAAVALLSCGPDRSADTERATSVAQFLVESCPLADVADEGAHAVCAQRLATSPLLRSLFADPLLWGQQSRLWDYTAADFNTTRFNSLVFRKMYLSLFMFSPGYTVEQSGDFTVVHLPQVFRNGMDPGRYPYPFWHNPNKWRDYQLANELHLVFRGGRVVAALRSAVRLTTRPHTTRAWDGLWFWDGGTEPRVSLYRGLFSPSNPHVARLDTAYRALEDALRPYACAGCHRPDNPAAANPLELLTYPNQALTSRRSIVGQLENGLMPPAAGTQPAGIADQAERARLVELARAFQLAADDALAAEGEGSGAATGMDAGAD